MRALVSCLCFLITLTGFSCTEGELPGIVPTTQHSACFRRWQKDRVTVISEKECIPCRELLFRMKKEMSERDNAKVKVLWIDSNPVTCLESAQKFRGFQATGCVTKKEAEVRWGIKSTPMIFWMRGDEKRTQIGLPDQKERLPWISSP